MSIPRSSLAAIVGTAMVFGIIVTPAIGASPDPTGELTLRQALELALAGNPDLASFSWEVRSGDARVLQAGLIPNPEIGVNVENILGSGPFRNFDSSETTLSISQLVELGGKRAARIRLASAGKEVTVWDYEAKRADLAAEVAKSFVGVLSTQERVALAEETTRLAEEVLIAVSARVAAGKISPVEETKARVAFSVSRIEMERVNRSLEAARTKLSATWGSSKPVFSRAVGRLDQVAPIPSVEELSGRLSRNPDIARWAVELEQRRAVLSQERAGRVPDVTLSAGVRRLRTPEGTDDPALVFSAAIPLPLFNRNQGKILESKYQVSKAEREREAAGNRVRAALSDAYQALAIGYMEATTLKSVVLPGARSAFESAREGFRQGKFGYLDVLDAQRTLFEARGRYVEALAAYHRAAADIERLIGGGLGGPSKSTETK
ncbi:MAG: TolC family protein [Deltaproteobacteria bacterium]|nr:TolC family protein [Deltaproteobacteria bacterium]